VPDEPDLRGISDPNYGPPVTEGTDPGQSGAPAGTTGTTVSGTSGSAAGATGTTVSTPGGSPTIESGQDPAFQSTVVSVAPTTATQAGGNLALTVTGTKFTPQSAVVVDGKYQTTTYTSATSLGATVDRTALTTGAKVVKVQTGAFLSTTSATLTLT
jgi:hypothetical protein